MTKRSPSYDYLLPCRSSLLELIARPELGCIWLARRALGLCAKFGLLPHQERRELLSGGLLARA